MPVQLTSYFFPRFAPFFISQTWTRTWNEEFNFDSLRLLILKFFTIHICVCWFDSRAKKSLVRGSMTKFFKVFEITNIEMLKLHLRGAEGLPSAIDQIKIQYWKERAAFKFTLQLWALFNGSSFYWLKTSYQTEIVTQKIRKV